MPSGKTVGERRRRFQGGMFPAAAHRVWRSHRKPVAAPECAPAAERLARQPGITGLPARTAPPHTLIAGAMRDPPATRDAVPRRVCGWRPRFAIPGRGVSLSRLRRRRPSGTDALLATAGKISNAGQLSRECTVIEARSKPAPQQATPHPDPSHGYRSASLPPIPAAILQEVRKGETPRRRTGFVNSFTPRGFPTAGLRRQSTGCAPATCRSTST